MNIGELLEINKPSDLEINKLKNISIYSSDAAVNLIEGIGAVGTLMFQRSCSDNDNLNKDIIWKLGLLIQESIIIASALNSNAGLAEDEIKSRSAPPLHNQKPEGQANKIIGVIDDINNAELSLQQLKSDLYENEPEKEIIFAQLDLVASKLSGSLDQLEKMIGNNHD